MSQEIVGSSARMLAITCLAIAVLSIIFDQSEIRNIRLVACALVGAASGLCLWLIRKRRFALAVLILLISLYAASAAGAIGTQTGLRAPSLLVLSMFSLICAFAFPKWLAVSCIILNVAYLMLLFALERTGVIDPMAHVVALNSTSVLIVLVTVSVIFGLLGFPLGKQVDRAMRRMQQSRRHLGRSREMYRALIEGAPIGVVTFDSMGLITSVNPVFCEWMGERSVDLPGSSVELLLRKSLPPPFRTAGAAPLRFDLQLEGCQHQQSTRWLSVTVSAFPHDTGVYRGGVVLLLDETQRKQSELELIRAKEAAEAAALAKSRFMSHMSHELRTPMTGIIGSIDLARDERVSPDKRKRMLGLLDASARSMLRVLDDILDATRLGEGRLKLSPEPFNPHDLIVETQRLFRAAAEARGLSLSINWTGDMSQICVADATRVRQVLGIILDNSIRFTDHGGVTLTATLKPVAEKSQCLFVSIRDTGVGLTAAHQDALFQPFTELGLKRAENQRGAGLGLAIARGLVELMGGRIGVQSEAGVGSEFWFELKLPTAMEIAEHANG